MVIAIDGPAGAGKSAVSRGVAAALGYSYLDSGAMYRCVALAALERGADLADPEAMGEIARQLSLELKGGQVRSGGRDVSAAIRTPAVSAAASVASAHPPVRAAMLTRQRQLLAAGRYVAEGRDIGTVVAPDAELKVFLTATPEERARRRAADLHADAGVVLVEQALRDARDTARAHSPLRPAPDAVVVDTTGLSVEQVVERIAALLAGRRRTEAAR
jgi:cytidylate kinase